MKAKPDFFIVGAAKSGTTSLYNYLVQHPEVYFSPIKEPNYFSNDIDVSKFSFLYKQNTFLDTEKYFSNKVLQNLSITFVRNIKHYERLFELGGKFKTRGESSTSYLYSKTAAQNIYDYNPQSKIIVVLRNPIERAFSHYKMALRSGHTKLKFKEAVEKDLMAKDKAWGVSALYIELGLYYDQLMRYYSIFPTDQIKVFLFKDLKNSTNKVLKECFEFLEVNNINIEDKTIYNFAKSPQNLWLNYFFTRMGLKNFLKRIAPESIINIIKKSFLRPDRNILSENDFKFLLNIYEEDIKKTASLLNQDLSNWRNYKDV
ncbi:MAG: sulfotransferase [Bacteroidales bacterium]|jgi:hypothetical protein|nr:sulfotransferase [Bacteroidales bacterium]